MAAVFSLSLFFFYNQSGPNSHLYNDGVEDISTLL